MLSGKNMRLGLGLGLGLGGRTGLPSCLVTVRVTSFGITRVGRETG